MDIDMQKLVSQSATSEEIEAKAKQNGMLSMIMDGFSKAASGITTLEEVLRVTKE